MTDPAPVSAPGHHIQLTRIFDAPPPAVFAAWTDPEQVAAWFCPDGFRVPAESVAIEPWAGGRYELTMVHRSGRQHVLRYRIVEIVEPELLVLESAAQAGAPTPTVTRIELADEGARTRMTLSDGPYPAEGGAAAEGGWGQAFDKLHRLLG